MRSLFARHTFSQFERSLFYLLLGLHMVPIWAFRYFASTDGPAHLYNAWVLKAMLLDPHSRFHHLLAFNPNLEPNYLSHGLLAALLTVLPPWLAEKAVLTLYVAGLPLAVRYLLRSWQPAAGFLAVLAFPFIYSVVLQWGFYNFCLSMVLLMLALGYWKRHVAGTATARCLLGLTSLVTLLYLAHPLAYLAGGLLLGLLATEQLLLTQPAALGGCRRWWKQLGLVALAFLPTLPLLAWYFWRKGGEGNSPTVPHAYESFTDWLALEPLRFMGSAERSYRILIMLLLLACLLHTAWQHRRGQALAPVGAFLAGVLLLGVGYVIVPDAMAGGSIIRPRLGLLSYLVLLGALATVPYGPVLRWSVLVAGFGIAAVFLGFRLGRYRTLHAGLAEYRSAAAYLQPGRTLVPLQFAHVTHMPNGKEYFSYIDAFGHSAGYLAVERNLVSFENYEAETGYFPLVWRPNRQRLTEPDSLPRRLALGPRTGSGPPDYVLVWGAPDTTARRSPNRRRALAQLDSCYRLLYRSRTGLVLLYQHRAASGSASAR